MLFPHFQGFIRLPAYNPTPMRLVSSFASVTCNTCRSAYNPTPMRVVSR